MVTKKVVSQPLLNLNSEDGSSNTYWIKELQEELKRLSFEQGGSKKKAKGKGRNPFKCYYCKIVDHISEECKTRKADAAAKGKTESLKKIRGNRGLGLCL